VNVAIALVAGANDGTFGDGLVTLQGRAQQLRLKKVAIWVKFGTKKENDQLRIQTNPQTRGGAIPPTPGPKSSKLFYKSNLQSLW
jgi:hypothetical protein